MTLHRTLATLAVTGLAAAAGGCAPAGARAGAGAGAGGPITYHGVETRLLAGDLVGFRVAVSGKPDRAAAISYATCAAAQYALIRGFGFARHVRTNVDNQGGVWRGDAVYTISAALPRGVKTIDAEVTVRDCGAQGIPTV